MITALEHQLEVALCHGPYADQSNVTSRVHVTGAEEEIVRHPTVNRGSK